jgi:hypothetical protein
LFLFFVLFCQHVNRDIKLEEKALEEVLRQTRMFTLTNGAESEEKRERLQHMSDEAQR